MNDRELKFILYEEREGEKPIFFHWGGGIAMII
jgi:hypothetical protein